jgi:hypothetical protein
MQDRALVIVAAVVAIIALSLGAVVGVVFASPTQLPVIITLLSAIIAPTLVALLALLKNIDVSHKQEVIQQQQEVTQEQVGELRQEVETASTLAVHDAVEAAVLRERAGYNRRAEDFHPLHNVPRRATDQPPPQD